MLWGKTIFTKVLVVPLPDGEHRVDAVRVVSKICSIELLEERINSYGCARIRLHKDKIYHSCTIKFHLANRVVVKPKMFLLRKQVVVSCDQENVLDKVRDEAAMELVVKLTFVIAVVARVESFHQEQRR